MKAPSVIVIGAGVGGIATATHQARRGMRVTVLEKNSRPGGRCDHFTPDGQHFDTGPTLFIMPLVFEAELASLGASMHEMLDLQRVDPTYRLIFDDGSQLALTSDLKLMQEQLESIQPGSFQGYLRYLEEGHRHYHLAMERLVNRDFRRATEFFNFNNHDLLFRLKPLVPHYRHMSAYFDEPRLKAAFTFQRELLDNLQKAGEQQNSVMMMRVLDKEFGTVFFDLNDCLINLRQDLAFAISQDRLRIYTDFQRYLYETNSSLMISMHRVGVRPPAEMRGAVRRVLSTELDRLVREILEQERIHGNGQVDWKQSHYDIRSRVGRLHAVLQEAGKWDLRLRVSNPARQLGEEMVRLLEGLIGHFDSRQAARLMRLVMLCRDLDAKPELWLLQTLYYRMVKGALSEPILTDRLLNQDGFVEVLHDFMHCRFAELLRIQTSLDIGDDATGTVRT